MLYSGLRKEFYTPYKQISVDVTANLECKRFQNTPQRIYGYYYDFYIINKAIHIFSNLETATYNATSFINKAFKADTYTFACIYYIIIPKGTKYWIGKYNDMCAKSICFRDIVHVFCNRFANTGRNTTFLQNKCITLLKDGVNEDILRNFFHSKNVDKIICKYTEAEL